MYIPNNYKQQKIFTGTKTVLTNQAKNLTKITVSQNYIDHIKNKAIERFKTINTEKRDISID